MVWDMKSFDKLRTIPVFESIESIQLLSLPSLENHVITMGNAGLLKLWNLDTGRLVHEQDKSESLKSPRTGSNSTNGDHDLDSCIVQSTQVFGENQKSLALVTVDDAIVFVKIDPDVLGKLSANQTPSADAKLFHSYKQFIGNHGEILDLKFVDVEERLLAVATNSPDIKIYDVNNWDCKILKGS